MKKNIINKFSGKDFVEQIDLFLKLSNTISDLIVIKDLNRKYIGINTAFEQFVGIPKNELIGKTNFDCVPLEVAKKLDKLDMQVIKSGKSVNCESLTVDANGNKVILDTHKAPIFDENENVFGILSISRDITDIKKVEKSLLLKDKLISIVAEATNELVKNLDFDKAIINAFDKIASVIDVDRIVFFENKFDTTKNQWYHSYKHEWVSDPQFIQIDDESLKYLPADINPLGMHSNVKDPIIHNYKTSKSNEKKVLKRYKIKSVILFPINIDDFTVGYVGFDDCRKERTWSESEKAVLLSFAASLSGVTERNLKREKEKENEVKLQFTLDSMVDAHINTDTFGIIQSCNPATENIFGYTQDELYGTSIDNIFLQKFFIANQGEKIENKKFNYDDNKFELSGINKKGKIIPLKVSISEIYYGDQVAFSFVITDISKEKEIERTKNEFVSIVSHELRTPLTSIRGSLGLILSGAMGTISDEIKELINIANNNSLRLIQLINDILDIEKIEAGKMNFVFDVCKLMPIIEQCIENNKLYAQQYNVKLELENTLPEIKVNVDKDRLIQVITNLLSNASKFSPFNGIVKISVGVKNKLVRVNVKDSGKGIPEDFKDKIFQKFAQADSSDSRKKGGTGLGLSICKAIIEKLDGNIGFESKKNSGTTFYIDLPIYEDVLNENICPLNRKSHILICEDNKDTASYISLLLEQNNYLPEIAHDAEQAKQLLNKNYYVAAIIDIVMPGQDGISLIQELRANGNDIPVIIVSVKAEEENTKQANNIDVVDWINKPIDQERLITAVNNAIKTSYDLKPSILHIENDIDVQNVVFSMLQNIACISKAINIKEAKQLLKENHYDLVIIDIVLPDGNGLDLLPLINNNIEKTSALIFSAHDVETSIACQVDAVLFKSKTSNTEFVSTVKKILKFPV